MNTRLLRRIQKKILKEPENFDMYSWHCGTAHCIGGWAAILSVKKNQTSDFETYELKNATKFLKLDEYHFGTDLLFLSRWPEKFYEAYRSAILDKEHAKAAQVAVELIDYFIENKGSLRHEPSSVE